MITRMCTLLSNNYVLEQNRVVGTCSLEGATSHFVSKLIK